MSNNQKLMDKFAEELHDQGCYVRRIKGGYFFLLPHGKPTVLHRSPSDNRWKRNLRADIERAGLTWPEAGDRLG